MLADLAGGASARAAAELLRSKRLAVVLRSEMWPIMFVACRLAGFLDRWKYRCQRSAHDGVRTSRYL